MRNKTMLTVLLGFLCLIVYSVEAHNPTQSREQRAQGKRDYLRYCASCHGIDGSGNGPASSSLKQTPPDLRRIQARFGRFPTEDVRKHISGTLTLPVHGAKDMPVWGMILTRTDISNLIAYLESIQRPPDPAPAD